MRKLEIDQHGGPLVGILVKGEQAGKTVGRVGDFVAI